MTGFLQTVGPAIVETGLNAIFGGGNSGSAEVTAANQRFVLARQIEAGRKKWDNRRHMNRFRDLRKAADKGGVNFLTALQSGYAGGPYWGGSTVPSGGMSSSGGRGLDFSALGSALAEYATPDEKEESTQKRNERQRKEAADQLKAVEKDQANQGGASGVTDATVEELSTSPAKGIENVRPKAFGDDLASGYVRVRMPDGAAAEIPQGAADRINGADLNAGGQMIVEDFEALFGEEGGQAVALPRLPGTIQTTVGGVSGYDPEERERRFDSRKRGGGMFGGSTDEEHRKAKNKRDEETLRIMKEYRDGIPTFMKN